LSYAPVRPVSGRAVYPGGALGSRSGAGRRAGSIAQAVKRLRPPKRVEPNRFGRSYVSARTKSCQGPEPKGSGLWGGGFCSSTTTRCFARR